MVGRIVVVLDDIDVVAESGIKLELDVVNGKVLPITVTRYVGMITIEA